MAKNNRKPGRPPGSKNKKTNQNKSKAENNSKSSDKQPKQSTKTTYKLNPTVVDEIFAIIFIAFGIFLIVALFTDGAGQFGSMVSDVLKGLFGFVAKILPFYLILIGVLMFMGKTVHLTVRSIIILVVISICLSMLNSTAYMTDTMELDIRNFYVNGTNLNSGGLIGMLFAWVFMKCFGNIGLWIITLAIIVVCVMLFVNTPVSRFFEKRREYKEKRQKKKEQERIERIAEREIDLTQDFQNRNKSKYNDSTDVNSAYHSSNNDYKTDEKSNVIDFMNKNTPFVSENEYKKESPQCNGQSENFVNDKPSEAKRIEKEIKNDEPKANKNLTVEDFNTGAVNGNYKFPPINLLESNDQKSNKSTSNQLNTKVAMLENTLRNFKVDARVINVTQGPTVTRFEIQPNVGVKVSRIVSLADDIALNLRAKSIRIEAPIPGKAAVGIEIENETTNMVRLREIIESKEFKTNQSKISFALGKDIAGRCVVADLKSMPHLLIAGATGSGKSVCINSIITSILYKASPDEVKLIMIDPKVVELGNYNGIPHLLVPVVTEPKKAAAALNWAVAEMTSRYKKFAELGVKNLKSYNEKVTSMKSKNDEEQPEKLPQIVIVIDELADLMMVAKKQVEESICRLAQLARAAGMHLIVATQRPSVNVVTGVIKANIPARIAFAVSSYHDSQTIIDTGGAESLVGNGDMLFMPSGGLTTRIQGAFLSEKEVNAVIEYIKEQVDETEYSETVMNCVDSPSGIDMNSDDDEDELMEEAIEHILKSGQASVSMLQRRFRIGYNRAARIIDDIEARGIIGPSEGSKPRQVLVTQAEYEGLSEEVE